MDGRPNVATCSVVWQRLVAVVMYVAAAWTHGDSSDSMALRLVLAQDALSRNEPVVASLFVRNTSDTGKHLDLGKFGRSSVNVNVVYPQGDTRYTTAWDARAPVADRFHQSIVEELPAGEEVAAFILLNRWHRFTAVGEYSVHVEVQRRAFVDLSEVRTYRVGSDGTLYPDLEVQEWLEEPVLRSNSVTVHVGPRDEAKLRTVADTLWKESREGGSAATLALAWIADPVAVPALAQLLRNRSDGTFNEVLAAAERAGTSEAVDVLLGLHAANVLSTRLTLRSLGKIARNNGADPAARKRAEGAMGEMRESEGE